MSQAGRAGLNPRNSNETGERGRQLQRKIKGTRVCFVIKEKMGEELTTLFPYINIIQSGGMFVHPVKETEGKTTNFATGVWFGNLE